MNKQKVNQEIIELTDKEQARIRINLWHGSANNYINMIKESIGNSLDIFDKEIIHNIEIKLHNSNKITYKDDGIGIPVEGVTSRGTNNYEAIFEHPFAGSKYNAETKTVGQNGIFLFSLAMTSEDIDIKVGRPDGNLYNVSYHKGDRVKDLEIIGKTDKTFSEITFSLDEEVWNSPSFTFEEVCNIAQAQASLGNVNIKVIDEENNLEKNYRYENGISGYFNDVTNDKNFIVENIRFTKTLNKSFKIKKKQVDDEFDIDLIFNFSNDSNENFQKDFLNTADLIKHGTIQDGVILGFKNAIHKWLNANKKYKKKDKPICLEDIMICLNYICNVQNKIVEYENQTKQKTDAKYYKHILQEFIEESCELYFIENPNMAKKICEQILVNSKARLTADKARQNVQKKLGQLGKTNSKVKIDGLTDCNMKESELKERTLLIVEGKSAKSTVVEAYDNRIDGAIGLRGRFISCLKKSVEEVLNNDPAYTLIQALGCGIQIPYEERELFKDIKSYDESNLRYNNIGILTDADCFGSGIRLALLTFFYKYMPNLLKEGKIFIVVTPRYEIKMKDGTVYYPYNDREKEELFKTIKVEEIDKIGIVKGIGEFDKEDFWENVLKPEAREKTFIQVDYNETEEEVNKLFEDYMGEDTTPRKEFVKEFITKVNLEEVN